MNPLIEFGAILGLVSFVFCVIQTIFIIIIGEKLRLMQVNEIEILKSQNARIEKEIEYVYKSMGRI